MKWYGNWHGLCIRSRKRAAGFTRLELIVVIVVISVLMTAALDRFLYYQERAEKAVMDATLEELKMMLRIHMVELISTNRQAATVELERENPMRWLEHLPANYAGEYQTPVKPGNWYYAADTKQLVYVPNSRSYLQLDDGGDELRFQVGLRYDDVETASGKIRTPTGVTITPVRPYRWF